MHAQVPQFIDIEDRIIGPFTLKQFGYLAAGAVVVGIFYMIFELWIVIIFGIPVFALSGALAFYTKNGRPFIYYAMSFLGYGVKQHIYVWKKPLEEYDIFFKQKTLEKEAMKKVEFTQSSIKKSGWSLDLFGKKEVAPQTELSPQEELQTPGK